jgi:molybdopterin-containing oxidoreductase family iron-sulfur binding subunit
MSRHFQLEANMTLSGAAADRRLPMSTANQKQALVHIYIYCHWFFRSC